jgi:hypothetical protein
VVIVDPTLQNILFAASMITWAVRSVVLYLRALAKQLQYLRRSRPSRVSRSTRFAAVILLAGGHVRATGRCGSDNPTQSWSFSASRSSERGATGASRAAFDNKGQMTFRQTASLCNW